MTGEIIAAGAGYFARVKLMKAGGAVIDPSRITTIEDFIAARDRVFDLSTAKPYTSTLDDETKRALGLL